MSREQGNSDTHPEDDPDQTLPLGHEMPHPSPIDIFKEVMAQPEPTPATRWKALSTDELNELLPDYTIIQLLGRGGMGAVYKAIQKSLDRPVAIKLLPGEFCEDIEFEARFRREAKAMARLNHPNIVQIHDFGQTTGGHYFFVMEYVDGADLLKLIRDGLVEPDSALKVIIQVCEALQYAHDHGYVHRDIKPANILLNGEGVVKVGDFGLAKLIDLDQGSDTEMQGLTITGYSMGTPHYVAPEQIDGSAEIDYRADIYSLGVMFYELLTGEIPRGAFDPPSDKIQVDVRIDDVVLKAMQQKPERRYQAAKDVESDVKIIRSNPRGQTMAFKEKQEVGANGGKSKKGWLAVLVSLLMISLAVGGVVWKPWENADVDIPESDPIKPAVEEKVNPGLPPVLAQMKKRGGKLKGWISSGQIDRLNLSLAQGISDFVSLDGSVTPNPNGFDSEGYRWLARRASGRNIANLSNFEEELETISRHLAVLKNGQLLRCYNDGRSIDRGVSGIIDAETLALDSNWPLILRRDGSLLLDYFGRGDQEADRKKIRQIIKPLNDVVKIDQCYESSIILRANGEVISWRGRNLVTPDPPLGRVIDVVAGPNFFVSLDDSGTVRTWTDNSDVQYVDVPKDLGKAYGIRAFDTLIAAQMDDGTWRIWGGFDDFGVRKKLNSLGPAVDLLFFGLKNRGEGSILWIEPADQSSPDPVVKIELPPALAGMKQRGGKLKGWLKSERYDLLNLELAEGVDDFIALDGSIIKEQSGEEKERFRWLGRRAGGTSVSNLSNFNRAEQLVSLNSHFGVLRSGEMLDCWNLNRKIYPDLKNVIDAKTPTTSFKSPIALFGDGSLALFGAEWQKPELQAIRELIGSLKDVVKIEQGSFPAVILRANGEVISWTRYQLDTPDSPLSNIVDIAAGDNFWIALDADGKVHSFQYDNGNSGSLSVPSDLGSAYAVRAGTRVAAAQMADGTWHAWGDYREGVVAKINELGPAVDLLFSSVTDRSPGLNDGGVLWIESAKPAAVWNLSKKAPKIELPHSLAAMKQRGGILKGWINEGELDLTRAQGLDDFISLDGFPSEEHGFRWLGIRSNDTSVASLSGFERGSDLVSLSSHNGVLRSGELLHCYRASRTIDPEIKDAVDAEIQDGAWKCSLVLQRDGSLKLIENLWAIPELAEVREQLKPLTDVVKIEQSHKHSIVLRANGEIIAWSGYDLLPPDRPLQNIVDVAAGSGVIALDVDGKVQVWADQLGPDSVVPLDLGKAFAVRAIGGVWAAQMEDGSWRAWGGKGTRETIELINSIGPAVDILPGGHNGGPETLLWIEPAAPLGSAEIELPPALAAMKQQGGILKGWANDGSDLLE